MHRWPTALAEELEERLLYSADLAPAVLIDDRPERVEHASLSEARAIECQPVELVVIDAGLTDAERIAEDLHAQRAAGRALEVVLIGADDDGIGRIGAALAGRQDIGAVHVLAHGADGSIRLGGVTLDQASLVERANEIAAWGHALAADADLLIYGCDVAAGPDGRILVQGLAALTGADVAASDDATGAGGDWLLEHRQGAIEAGSALSASLQASYGAALAVASGASSKGMAVFAASGDGAPQVDHWDGVDFGGSADSAAIGTLRNIEAAEAPTRDETLVIGVTAGGVIRAERYDGTTGAWNPLTLTGATSEASRVAFAVAYEQASGDALLVWDDHTQPAGSQLRFAVWNGTTLTPSAAIGPYTGAEPQYLQLAARPGSDEMVLVVNDANSDDHALVWNGASWGDAVTLDTSGNAESDQTALDVAYEAASGRAMVAYGKDGDSEIYFRHWNGAAWSGESAAGFPNVLLSEWRWITLASDPNSDRIAIGASRQNLLDFTQAFSVWNGSSWGSVVGSSALTGWQEKGLGVAFEARSGDALAAYETGDNRVHYRTWSAAGGWSGQVAGPDLGSNLDTLTLTADPRTDTIMLATLDGARDVNFVPWTGSAWGARSELTSDSGATDTQPFAFVWQTGAAAGAGLWVSSESDHSSPGWPGVHAIADSEVLQLSGPGLTFSPLPTNGVFSHVFDIAEFATDGNTDIDALHYVSRSVALPGLTLLAGDVLFSTENDETLSANNTLSVIDDEVVLFRPDTPGDYRSGTFIVLLDNFASLHGGNDTTSIALVEQATPFGEVTLNAGTFLFVADNGGEKDIYRFVPTGVGTGSTAGSVQLILRHDDLDTNQAIQGLHIVSSATTLGNLTLPAGALLVALDSNDNDIGVNDLDVDDEDVFYLTVTQTSLSGTGQVNAYHLLDADDIGVSGNQLDALAVYSANTAPVLDATGAPVLAGIGEGAVNPAGTTVAALLATGAGGDPISDVDGDPEGIAVVGLDAANGVWQYSTTGGASWTAFGAVSSASATLLEGSALVRFVPNTNYVGAATIQFRAWDQYSGANGQSGVNVSVNGGSSAFSSAIETASITVSAVNDNPVLALNAGVTVNQGASAIIANTRLAATDIDHAAAALTYTLTVLPTHGVLRLNGVDLTLIGDTFTQADIDAGLLQYVNDGTPNPSDSFAFGVTDAAGGSAGAPATFAITVATANAAPSLVSNVLTIVEGGTAVPSLAATDADNTPGQLAYTISGVTGGFFELVANPGVAVTTFTQAQVDASAVRFVHDGTEAAPAYTAVVSDGAASAGPSAVTVFFTNANDAPAFGTPSLNIVEGASATLSVVASDPDTAAASLTYTVSGVTHGQFELVAVPGVAITSFTQAQIDAGDVVFVHDGGEDAPAFALSLSDGFAASGPIAGAVSYTSANDAPIVAVNALGIAEGGTVVLGTADLAASDPDDTAGALTWTVATLTGGRFEFAGNPGTAITSFTQADVDAGSVRFVHDGNDAAPAYTLMLGDDDTATGPSAAVIIFTATNDAPVIAANTLALAEGGSIVLGAVQIGATDPDNTPVELTWTVTAVSGGRFERVAAAGTAITSFTQAEIDAGAVRFVHDGGEAAPSYSLAVSDGLGSAGPASAIVAFAPQDDAPVLAANAGVTLVQGGSVAITSAMLQGSDVDTVPGAITLAVVALPVHGALLLGATPLALNASFSQADVDAGRLRYVHDGSAASADAFVFRVADASTALAPATFLVDVRPAPATPAAPAAVVLEAPAPAVDSLPAPAPAATAPAVAATVAQARSEVARTDDGAARTEAFAPALASGQPDRHGESPETVRWLAGLAEAPRAPAASTTLTPVASVLNRVASALNAALTLPGLVSEAQAHERHGIAESDSSKLAALPRDALLELEQVRQQLEEQIAQGRNMVASTIAVSTGLSVGYVLWLVRGGLLLTSVLSALPAWQVVDPLPVLGNLRRQDADDEAEDALEGMFQRSHAAAARPRAAPLEGATVTEART